MTGHELRKHADTLDGLKSPGANIMRQAADELDALDQYSDALQEVIRDSPLLLDLSETDTEFCEKYDRWRTHAIQHVVDGDTQVCKDAKRYQWLRDNPEHASVPYYESGKWHVPYLVNNDGGFGGGVGNRVFDTLDEAIDEAIAAGAQR